MPPQAQVAPPVPMGAPTQFPGQPVTAGASFGPGPGTEVLPSAPDDRVKLRAALPVLLKMADLPTTSEATRNAIRYLRGTL